MWQVPESLQKFWSKIEGNFYFWAIGAILGVILLLLKKLREWFISAPLLEVFGALVVIWIVVTLVATWITSLVKGRIILPDGYSDHGGQFGRNALRAGSIVLLFGVGFALFRPKANHAQDQRFQPYLSAGPTNLNQCFDSDFGTWLRTSSSFQLVRNSQTQECGVVEAVLNFDAGSMFLAYYIPNATNTYSICRALASNAEMAARQLREDPQSTSYKIGDSRHLESKDLKFTGRVFIYHECRLVDSELEELTKLFRKQNLDPIFRGPDYLISVREFETLNALKRGKTD